jgi:hypothetical protein
MQPPPLVVNFGFEHLYDYAVSPNDTHFVSAWRLGAHAVHHAKTANVSKRHLANCNRHEHVHYLNLFASTETALAVIGHLFRYLLATTRLRASTTMRTKAVAFPTLSRVRLKMASSSLIWSSVFFATYSCLVLAVGNCVTALCMLLLPLKTCASLGLSAAG